MKAMLIRGYGGPDVFKLGEIDTPRPCRDEVLVRVRGSSVNPVDCAIRSGMLKWIVRLRFPAVLGADVAGEVIERGEGATRFAVGDRVFGYTGLRRGGGGYGEFAAVPEAYLAHAPSTLTWAEAGTVPGVGATAYEARRHGVLITLTGIPPQAALAKIRNMASSRRTVVMFVQTSGALLEGLARMIGVS
jgi:NADPH:quinone reductase-like Zn-dependent oxidoreductase